VTDGSLVYNFGGIDTMSAQITAFVNHMNEKLAEVDGTFKNLLADGWSGSAANAFQGCSIQWHKSADQMAQTLQQLSTKVGNAGANMAQADAAAAARF